MPQYKKRMSQSKKNTQKATSFVKWAGGKRNIIKQLVNRLPNEINDYYEPFVGGGALFFEICKKAKTCYLSDINSDLIISYNVIKKSPDKLIKSLEKHQRKHCEEYYYKIRSQHELQDSIKIASRFLYLNKTCYNGLYRVNKKGQFNVAFGRYKNANIVQEENIKLCHEALKNTIIKSRDFKDMQPKKNDFVYFDPPYHPINSESFKNYSKISFREEDQIRLRDFAVKLTNKEVNVMLSNSYTPFILKLYNDKIFHINIVKAPRLINSKANQRNKVKEVLITNYSVSSEN